MIYVEIDESISIKESAKSLFLTFSYDPQIVNKIKSLKNRVWHSNIRAWEVPISALQELKNMFGEGFLAIDEHIDLNDLKEMSNMNIYENEKWEIFNPLFKHMSGDIKDFTIHMLKQVPEYFYEVPASSTGKYHPSYALGDGGLIRHTLGAGLIAIELFRNDTIYGKFTDREKELMLSAIILHDTFKSGIEKSKYTVAEHPILASNFVKETKQEFIAKSEVQIIADCILSHMGQWNTDRSGREIMDKPKTQMQSFVHLCDYLASRKILEINFNTIG